MIYYKFFSMQYCSQLNESSNIFGGMGGVLLILV